MRSLRFLRWAGRCLAAPKTWYALCLSLASAVAWAQPTPGQLLQDIRTLQPPQHELPMPVPEAERSPVPVEAAAPSALRFVVQSFAFEGDVPPLPTLEPVLAALRDRPITYDDLRQATQAIADVYRERGQLVRAVLPPQDITEGQVTIHLVQGQLGALAIDHRSVRVDPAHIQAWMDRQVPVGSPLGLTALDHALLTLGDVPALSAQGYLQAGEATGETGLALLIEDKPRYQGQALLDNFGDQNTGKVRTSAQFNVNGLIDWADQLSLYGLRTQASTYARAGWTTATAGATRGQRLGVYASTMDYRIDSSAFQAARISGASEVWGFEASDPVIRSRSTNVVASFNWAHNRFKSWSNDVLNADRSYTSHVAQFGVSGNWLDDWRGGGLGTASLMASMGDIDRVQSSDTNAVGGIFSKLRYGITRSQTLSSDWTLYASLTGQIASQNMDSSEQLYLGGPLNVRAYASGQGSASQGQLYTLELRQPLAHQMQLALFYDEGRAQTWKFNPASNNVDNAYTLRGAGVSIGWSGPYGVQVKATWAHRLGQPGTSVSNSLTQSGGLDHQRLWLNASLPF